MTDFFFLAAFYSGGRLVARSTPRRACLIIPLLNLLLTALLLARHHHTGRALPDFDSGDYGMLLTLNICSWPSLSGTCAIPKNPNSVRAKPRCCSSPSCWVVVD